MTKGDGGAGKRLVVRVRSDVFQRSFCLALHETAAARVAVDAVQRSAYSACHAATVS